MDMLKPQRPNKMVATCPLLYQSQKQLQIFSVLQFCGEKEEFNNKNGILIYRYVHLQCSILTFFSLSLQGFWRYRAIKKTYQKPHSEKDISPAPSSHHAIVASELNLLRRTQDREGTGYGCKEEKHPLKNSIGSLVEEASGKTLRLW